MKKLNSIIILLISLVPLYAQTVTQHGEKGNRNKMKFYYRDSHKNVPENLPPNINKEYVYHFSSNDSLLEKEITYNAYQQPVEVKYYSVPSKGELVEIDSFYYNSLGLLQVEIYYELGNNEKNDTTIIKYLYDKEKREISKVSTVKFGANKWLTSYEADSNGNRIKRILGLWDNNVDNNEEVYFFGETGRKDSIQIFINGKWFQTTEFKYDSLNNLDIYIRYSGYKALKAKLIFNTQGFATYVLTNELPNWNRTKYYNVEDYLYYSPEGYTKECETRIHKKRKYSKKHYFTYQNNSR